MHEDSPASERTVRLPRRGARFGQTQLISVQRLCQKAAWIAVEACLCRRDKGNTAKLHNYRATHCSHWAGVWASLHTRGARA